MNTATRAAIGHALGAEIAAVRSVAGGDVAEAFVVTLDDGRRAFVKTRADADEATFPAEARGLEWLAEAGAFRVPEVLAVGAGNGPGAGFLALELVEPAPRRADFDELLGSRLATLHRAGAKRFGLDHDNFIGPLPQQNDPSPSWATFYRDRRLAPQVELAIEAGLVSSRTREAFERLFDELELRLGPIEPPARLHGDLWSGNVIVDETGEPCLIDPAVYGGHREIDLGMMRLFGGFGPRVYEAYEATHPLAPGAEERIAIHQLYPLLVHVNLFGASYVTAVERAIAPWS